MKVESQARRRLALTSLYKVKLLRQNQRPIIQCSSMEDEVSAFAVQELKRFLKVVFNLESPVRAADEDEKTSGDPPNIWLGVPSQDAKLQTMLSDCSEQELLEEQEYLIGPAEVQGAEVLLLAGGSPAALLWAVYELAEFWGVRFLFDSEIIPSQTNKEWSIPLEPIRRRPLFTLRAWRGLNQLPHSSAYWGLTDFIKLIDQLSKMRFNLFFLTLYPYMPFVDFQWEGVCQQTGEMSFGWRFPIDESTIGREKFGGQRWYQNPDIPFEASYQEKLAAARKLVGGIRDYVRSRGMYFGVRFVFADPASEFKAKVCELAVADGFVPGPVGCGTAGRLGVWRDGIDADYAPYMSIRNQRFIDCAQAQLLAYFSEYRDVDYMVLNTPEWACLGADAEYSWQRLSDKYDLGPAEELERMIDDEIEQSRGDHILFSPERVRSQVYGDICTLALLDELLNARKCSKPPNGTLLVSLSDAVTPLVAKVLGPKVEVLSSLGGYLASDAVCHVERLKTADLQQQHVHVNLSIEDDNIGLTPQFTAPSLCKILRAARSCRQASFWCRQWLTNKVMPAVDFVSHAAWEADLTPDQAYRRLIEGVCGHRAVGPLLDAFHLAERLTEHNDAHGVGHSFLVPRMISCFWEEHDRHRISDELLASRPMYRQLIEQLEAARAVSVPQGQAFIDQFIGQARFADHWITAKQKLILAAQAHAGAEQARTTGEINRMDQQLQASLALLDEAIEASKTALTAWAEAVRDRADLGALAALNHFGHRYLISIRHILYLRTNCWSVSCKPSPEE